MVERNPGLQILDHQNRAEHILDRANYPRSVLSRKALSRKWQPGGEPLARLNLGDKEAFEEAYYDLGYLVFKYASRLIKGKDLMLAEQITEDTFLKYINY